MSILRNYPLTILFTSIALIYMVTSYGTWKRLMLEYSRCMWSDSPFSKDTLRRLNTMESIVIAMIVCESIAILHEVFNIF